MTIQHQILKQMRSLQEEYGTSIIFITHDLGVVAELCDRVVGLYCGLVMEEAEINDLFEKDVYKRQSYLYGNTAQFPPDGLSTAPAAAARHLRCQNAR